MRCAASSAAYILRRRLRLLHRARVCQRARFGRRHQARGQPDRKLVVDVARGMTAYDTGGFTNPARPSDLSPGKEHPRDMILVRSEGGHWKQETGWLTRGTSRAVDLRQHARGGGTRGRSWRGLWPVGYGPRVDVRSTPCSTSHWSGIASVASFVLWDLWADGSTPLASRSLSRWRWRWCCQSPVTCDASRRPLARVVKAVFSLDCSWRFKAASTRCGVPLDRFVPLIVKGSIRLGDLRVGWQQVVTAVVALGATRGDHRLDAGHDHSLASLAVGEDQDAARGARCTPRGGRCGRDRHRRPAGRRRGNLVVRSRSREQHRDDARNGDRARRPPCWRGSRNLGVAVAAAAGVGAVTARRGIAAGRPESAGLVESSASPSSVGAICDVRPAMKPRDSTNPALPRTAQRSRGLP